jgi:hypothetical protein
MREKPAVLLDISDFPAQQYRGLSANISVADCDLSAQRLDESVEAAKQRRLARPTLTDESDGASGWDVNAHVIERDYGSVSM